MLAFALHEGFEDGLRFVNFIDVGTVDVQVFEPCCFLDKLAESGQALLLAKVVVVDLQVLQRT